MKPLLRVTTTVVVLAAFTCPGESRVSAVQLMPRAEHRYAETDDNQATVTVLRSVYAAGDSGDIVAVAIIGHDYRNPAYSSVARPGEFAFASSAPNVASIAAPGIIRAIAPGEARITVIHLGFVDTLRVVVLPRLSALRLAVPSATLRTGERATVSLDAFDSESRPGVRVYGYLDADPLTTLEVREGSLVVQARAPGTARLAARVIGQGLRATSTVTVTP